MARLPESTRRKLLFAHLRGTWPVREEVIPIHGVNILCRIPGVNTAKPQPEVIVPRVEMHSMVVLE